MQNHFFAFHIFYYTTHSLIGYVNILRIVIYLVSKGIFLIFLSYMRVFVVCSNKTILIALEFLNSRK